jgi:DNA-binding PadR family transcriptional regulator
MNYMTKRLGIWEIAVLALLREAAMHPYQMQSLLRERHKDEILALKKGSLYHAIGRLVRAEFILAKDTSRNGRRPERTTYAITPAGRKELIRALRQIVAVPQRESSEFMAAMSFLVHLTPAEAILRLEERCEQLEQQITGFNRSLAAVGERVGRINLIESEYLVAMLKAELTWVRNLIAEIRDETFIWDLKTVVKEARISAAAAGHPEE